MLDNESRTLGQTQWPKQAVSDDFEPIITVGECYVTMHKIKQDTYTRQKSIWVSCSNFTFFWRYEKID